MKIDELKKQKSALDIKIKKMERRKQQRGLLKECKKIIGDCYKFRNGYSCTSEHWYIYAKVKNAIIDDDNSVYIILDSYEKTNRGEIKIGINIRQLESTNPMHCWYWISQEEFEENKQEIINHLTQQKVL